MSRGRRDLLSSLCLLRHFPLPSLLSQFMQLGPAVSSPPQKVRACSALSTAVSAFAFGGAHDAVAWSAVTASYRFASSGGKYFSRWACKRHARREQLFRLLLKDEIAGPNTSDAKPGAGGELGEMKERGEKVGGKICCFCGNQDFTQTQGFLHP